MSTQITGKMLADYLRYKYQMSEAISVDEFCKDLSFNPGFYNNVTNDPSAKPREKTIIKVCQAFDCNREDIINLNSLLKKNVDVKDEQDLTRYDYLRDPEALSRKLKEIMNNRELNEGDMAVLLNLTDSFTKKAVDGEIDSVSKFLFEAVVGEIETDEARNKVNLKQRLRDVVNVTGVSQVSRALGVSGTRIDAYLNDDPVHAPEIIEERLMDYFDNADEKAMDNPSIKLPEYAEPFEVAAKLSVRADMTASLVARRRKTPSPKR